VRREKAVVHSRGIPARELVRSTRYQSVTVEATRLLKPLVQGVARRLGD